MVGRCTTFLQDCMQNAFLQNDVAKMQNAFSQYDVAKMQGKHTLQYVVFLRESNLALRHWLRSFGHVRLLNVNFTRRPSTHSLRSFVIFCWSLVVGAVGLYLLYVACHYERADFDCNVTRVGFYGYQSSGTATKVSSLCSFLRGK